MLLLVIVKALLLFIFRLEAKTTSRICVLLAVKSGSALHESKQRVSKIKLKKVSSLVMFLIPHYIIRCYVEPQWCKIVVHCVLDKGFNSVPIESLSPNAHHPLLGANGNDLTKNIDNVDAASDLELHHYSFLENQTTVVHASLNENDPIVGFEMKTGVLYKLVYISNASSKSITSSIYKFKKCFRNNLKGAFLTHINDIPVFSKADAVKQLKILIDRGCRNLHYVCSRTPYN